MKKIYALALGALVLATGCSKDDPAPVLPDLVVNQVTLKPTYSQIKAPAQTTFKYDDVTIYDMIVGYENGQIIEYTPSSTAQNVVLVKKIKGENVIVPVSVTDGTTDYIVGGWDLASHEGVDENVKTVTIPSATANNMQGNSTDGITLRPFNNQFFTDLSDRAENLQAVYLEEGFPNYISDNGVIYRQDKSNNATTNTLVMVPRKYNVDSRSFTVPNDVQVIGSLAFAKCDQLERVIVSKDVKTIEDEAFMNTKNLIALDMLPAEAPVAYEHSFGHYTRKATLRIPQGSYASYFISNPFEEVSPNTVHPVPPTIYITGMQFDRNKYSAANTANWTDEDWAKEVPAPTAPAADADNNSYVRYQNALAGYANYQAALEEYNKNRGLWYTAAGDWNGDNQKNVLDKAEPIYPGKDLVAPKRPTNPGVDGTPEEIEEYNKELAKFYEETIIYQADQGAIAQFKVDHAAWEKAKNRWESTRGYQFFDKVEEVTFIY